MSLWQLSRSALTKRLSASPIVCSIHARSIPSGPPFTPQPEPKTAVKTLKLLSAHYNYLGSAKSREAKKASNDDNVGEWAGVMEQEYYDFVLFELPKIQF